LGGDRVSHAWRQCQPGYAGLVRAFDEDVVAKLVMSRSLNDEGLALAGKVFNVFHSAGLCEQGDALPLAAHTIVFADRADRSVVVLFLDMAERVGF
jgi:hypothetical protein